MTVTRLLAADDASALAHLLRRNRSFLAPWQPKRAHDSFSDEAQHEAVGRALLQYKAGDSVPLVVTGDDDELVGAITLQSIIRGAFQSCSVAYWLSEDVQGRGLATDALREAVNIAFGDLRLHRVQAGTLRHNLRSQRVLERLGFEQYGAAPAYMKIAGQWQDSLLFQLLTPTPERVVAD